MTSSGQIQNDFIFSPSSLVTVKFTARVTFKFTAKVTFKFTARVTFKFIPIQPSTYLWKTITPKNACIPRAGLQMKCTAQVYPLKLSIDLWKTITLNKFHILKNAHIPRTDFQMKCTTKVYSPAQIKNRSLENHYTK